MNVNKTPQEDQSVDTTTGEPKRAGYSSWFYWRRSGAVGGQAGDKQPKDGITGGVDKEPINGDLTAVATQTSRSATPVDANPSMAAATKGASPPPPFASSTSAVPLTGQTEEDANKLNLTGNSEVAEINKSMDDETPGELYRKSLRLTTDQIVSIFCLLLKTIINVHFSHT